MEPRRVPILPVVAAVGAATVLLLLPGVSVVARSTSAHFAFEGLIAGGTIAVAVLAVSRYRDTGDPHPLLVAVGFAVLAIHTLVFGIAVPISEPNPWNGFAFPSHAWQIGWVVAAACFALAVPAATRRLPLREPTVALLALVSLGVLDLVLIVFRRSTSSLSDARLLEASPFSLASALHWALMAIALFLLILAAWREHATEPSEHVPHPWLAVAYVVAAGAQVLFVARPTPYRPLVQPADLFPPLSVALAFVGFVVASRARVTSLRQESEQARELTSGRAEIASMISHELKNPIMSIKGLASTGTRLFDSMSDEEKLEFFKLIDDEAGRLKAVVEETATALKVDAGTLTYDIRPEDLGGIVEETAWRTTRGNHPLVVETEPGLSVPCDRARIGEVVAHLIDNAAKFSPEDAPIEVRTYRDRDGSAVLEVTDRGPGIPSVEREAVFAKFAQYRPPGYEEIPGSGLGLFICRAHVAHHGGRITVEDAPGTGTMLRVTLPGRGAGH